jgi:hypothetical protein
MVSLAALTVLAVVACRIAFAGVLVFICYMMERDDHRRIADARDRAKVESPPFAIYEDEVAEYHVRRAEYHSRLKWLYLRAMFEFWAKIPYRSLDPPGLEQPEVPYVPPPRPLVPARAKPDPLTRLSTRRVS